LRVSLGVIGVSVQPVSRFSVVVKAVMEGW
jgi:hypothetical protein